MSDIKFSVVIPTYNRAAFIVRTVETVLAQSYGNFEVLVIDDGSTDNTAEVMKAVQDPRVSYIRKANGERGAARNAGARLATGHYVNFFDSDDTLYPNHLAVAYSFITSNAGVEVFHLGYDVKDASGRFMRDSSGISNINDQILSGNLLSCNGVFVRRDIALENPFSEIRALSAIEDWELWVRLAARYTFHHEPTITSTVINHDERSVMSVNTAKLKERTGLFVDLILSNGELKKVFGNRLRRTSASALTYTALHLAIAHAGRAEVIQYTWRGIRTNPAEIFRKRFLVILKLLLLG